jgi:hypothetical protein
MGKGRRIQLGPLERASPGIGTSSFYPAQMNRSNLPNPPEEGDRSSIRNVVIFCHIYQRMDKVQNNGLEAFHVQILSQRKRFKWQGDEWRFYFTYSLALLQAQYCCFSFTIRSLPGSQKYKVTMH